MEKIAVFPGSFDPIHKGHESIIRRGALIFDKVIVAIGVNSDKKYMYSLEQRMQWLAETFSCTENVELASYEGLTVDFCKREKVNFVLRGLRTSADFEFERGIAHMNQQMNTELETIFMLTPPSLSALSSSIVRDIVLNKGNADQFMPAGIKL